MKGYRAFFLAVMLVLGVRVAAAQIPFFYGNATAFTPEISVINSGALLDAQATVSADRKYVTLNARSSNASLLALRSFEFQQGGAALGNVGDPPAAAPNARVRGGTAPSTGDNASNAVNSSPSMILAQARSRSSVLHRPGMSRIGGLQD